MSLNYLRCHLIFYFLCKVNANTNSPSYFTQEETMVFMDRIALGPFLCKVSVLSLEGAPHFSVKQYKDSIWANSYKNKYFEFIVT